MDKTSAIVITVCVVLLFFTWQTPPPVSQPTQPIPVEEKIVEKRKEVILPASVTKAKLTNFKKVTLANKEISLVVNPNLGGVSQVELATFKAEKEKNKPYQFPMEQAPLLQLKSVTGYPLVITGVKEDEKQLLLSGKVDGLPITFTQSFQLSSEKSVAARYILKSNVTFTNMGKKPISMGDLLVGIGEITPLVPGSSSYIYGGDTNQRLVWRDSQSEDLDYENVKTVKGETAKTYQHSGLVDWVALENRYFSTILNSSTKLQGASATAVTSKSDEKSSGLIGYGVVAMKLIQAGQSKTFDFSAYVGPKKYDYLSVLGQNQEDMLDLGWAFIRPLSKIILKMLIWLGGMGLNYGLVIIMITVIIKGLFWPITHKSSISMKKMSAIQPLIKEIREKHKGNQQIIQQKTMEIYKEHKINPVGGCLPMFIQIPVFFALYSTFRSAVELRHHSFLWCTDLARPDTVGTLFSIAINPLAILMVVTMFVQQLLAPTSADPNQKKMMLAMPFIMLFFMYDMPAGLTLYWTVSQLLSIVQQYFTNKSLEAR
jgi:YidC/Oxa1 family membrane protein insertase